ncbi:MAG: DUF1223 domain-containing protein [Chthoniobacterales bacterium]
MRTSLLELFTSEGCSSCPPAEEWFSSLRRSPELWKEVVPVAFHVDYWDKLGWSDPFASAQATRRQHDYAASWGSDSVYTPAFVLNGAEWRPRDLHSISSIKKEVGKLSATLHESGKVEVTFQPSNKIEAKWEAHVALLTLGASSDVKAGENKGRKLIHDFVVVDYQTSAMSGETPTATLRLPVGQIKHGQSALAVWVTETGKLEPRQAAGGNL